MCPDTQVRVLQMELRVGGRFVVEAQGASGPLYHLECTFREVRLQHSQFITAQSRDGHQQGWQMFLEMLAKTL